MIKLSRRNFVNNSLILGSLPFINFIKKPFISLSTSNNKIYTVNCGNFNSSKNIGVAIAEISKVQEISSKIEAIRLKYNYYSQIKYHSNDKFKLQVCKDLIDFFVEESDLKIYMKVIENPRILYKSLSPLKKIDFKINVYTELLSLGNFSKNVSIFMKAESPFGPSRDMKKKIETDESIKLSVNAVKGKEDDILQLLSFITGSILADLRGIVQNPIKLELLHYLKDKLEITQFISPMTKNNKLYII